MAAAKKVLTASIHVRDPKTQELLFLEAGSIVPNGLGKLISGDLLAKAGASQVKAPGPAKEEAVTAEAPTPVKQVEEVAPVEDSELDDGESFDTE